MDPKNYESVAAKYLGLKITQGYSINYKVNNVDVTMTTNEYLQNPGFTGTFKLTPGVLNCKVAPGSTNFDVSISPDLSAHGAKLTVFPLKQGAFNFNIKKVCSKTGFAAALGYNSEKNALTGNLYPSLNLKGAKITGDLGYNGKKGELNDLDLKLFVDVKNAHLKFRYESLKKNYRIGAFTSAKGVNFGGRVLLTDGAAKELGLYCMSGFNGYTGAIIAQVLNKKSLVLRLEGPIPAGESKVAFGAVVDMKEGDDGFKTLAQLGLNASISGVVLNACCCSCGQAAATVETCLTENVRLKLGTQLGRKEDGKLDYKYSVGFALSQ